METKPDFTALAESFDVADLVARGAYIEALERIMPWLYPDGSSKADRSVEAAQLRDALFSLVLKAMRERADPTKTGVRFGTSGWRGLLVDDFTVENVACVTQAVVDVVLKRDHFRALGVRDMADLKNRGCILAHDTRIAGAEFAQTAARILLAHSIRVTYLGMATTPEVSAAILETNAAFSINFTPSHNPFNYHGFKFNPADGGPAPEELTGPIAGRASEIFRNGTGYYALGVAEIEAAKQTPGRYVSADPMVLYREALSRRIPWLELDALVDNINSRDVALFVDNGFGATQGKYERLLEGVVPGKLHVFNGVVDYLFGGKEREPSKENFRALQEKMASSSARLTVGFMNDGDGDRFVGGGRTATLVMNKFGPLVVKYLAQEHGITGDVTRSVMTSHMADAALNCYLPEGVLNETRVGFQYMRPHVATSVNCWEESDGMSPQGWTLDKDGLIAALALISMVLHYDAPPEELLWELERELGYYYFERTKVRGALGGDALRQGLAARFGTITPESSVEIDGRVFHVKEVFTLDGYKIVFDSGWWFGVRPSGTEPVVRPYVETFAAPESSARERAEAERWQKAILGWLVREVSSCLDAG